MAMEEVWEIMHDQLFFIYYAYDVKIHAFVLMSNHYHLLISAPQSNLSRAMAHFSASTARRIVKRSGRINHIWAHRFHRCEITTYHYFVNVYKYIYQNPVRAGLVRRAEEYEFSTLNGLLGQRKILIPCESDLLLFDSGISQTLSWINSVPRDEDVESMRRSLKKTFFKLPRQKMKTNRLENQLL